MRTCVSVRTCYRTPRRHQQAAMNPSCQPQQGHEPPSEISHLEEGRKSSTYREEETTDREEAANPGLDGFISNALNTEDQIIKGGGERGGAEGEREGVFSPSLPLSLPPCLSPSLPPSFPFTLFPSLLMTYFPSYGDPVSVPGSIWEPTGILTLPTSVEAVHKHAGKPHIQKI